MKFRRKHITVIGGGLQGIQSAFYLCDNVLGKSPKFPRISLICTENGPLSRYFAPVKCRCEQNGQVWYLLNSFSVIQYVAPLGLTIQRNLQRSAKYLRVELTIQKQHLTLHQMLSFLHRHE